jgi:predicted dehydrogenase
MSETMKFAIVGCGAIADAHATAIRSSEEATLAAAVDPDEAARRKAADAWDCAVFSSLDDMLRETEVDAACICAPPAYHRESAERLLDAGVHVLCEKPLAPTSPDALAMVERAERSGRTLMVSSKYRYVDDLHAARRLIDEGRIGQPIYHEVTFCAPTPVADRWSVRPAVSGGGVVMDNASHAFDVLGEVLDAPIASVSASFGLRTVSPDVEDTAEVQFRTTSGAIGRVALSWTYFTKDLDYLVIQGTEGGIRVAWTGGLVRRHGDRDWSSFGSGYDKRAAFANQLKDFCRDARAGSQPKHLADAVRAIGLIEQIYDSQRSGRWQDLDAAPMSR